MAPSASLKLWYLVLAVFYASFSCCQAQNAVSIVARAILCFNNMTIYRDCLNDYRLTMNGTLNVPRNATNAFCNGPCMSETKLILGCVDGIMLNFQFYNGATVQAVSSTIQMACGYTNRRGNFNVSSNIVAGVDQVPFGSNGHPRAAVDGADDVWAIIMVLLILSSYSWY